MTLDQLMAIINKEGVKNILGMAFDNSSGVVFSNEDEFNPAIHIDTVHELIILPDRDSNNNIFFTYHPIDCIQEVMVRDSTVPFEKYNRRNLRG